jgi:hypothetical protein
MNVGTCLRVEWSIMSMPTNHDLGSKSVWVMGPTQDIIPKEILIVGRYLLILGIDQVGGKLTNLLIGGALHITPEPKIIRHQCLTSISYVSDAER